MFTVLHSMSLEMLTRSHTLDVVITRDVSCIIQGETSIVDPCLYDIKGNAWILEYHKDLSWDQKKSG